MAVAFCSAMVGLVVGLKTIRSLSVQTKKNEQEHASRVALIVTATPDEIERYGKQEDSVRTRNKIVGVVGLATFAAVLLQLGSPTNHSVEWAPITSHISQGSTDHVRVRDAVTPIADGDASELTINSAAGVSHSQSVLPGSSGLVPSAARTRQVAAGDDARKDSTRSSAAVVNSIWNIRSEGGIASPWGRCSPAQIMLAADRTLRMRCTDEEAFTSIVGYTWRPTSRSTFELTFGNGWSYEFAADMRPHQDVTSISTSDLNLIKRVVHLRYLCEGER
jgi:hypothetical protein